MNVKTYLRSILLGTLITLSLGGFMLHSRIHRIAQNPSFRVLFCAGILSIVVVSACRCGEWSPKTERRDSV